MTQDNYLPWEIMQFDPDKVPEEFQRLVPLAQRWSILDEGYLEDAVDGASLDEVRQLVIEIDTFIDAALLSDWLGKPDRGDDSLSDEWLAFVRLIDACDYARMRLKEEGDQKTES